MMVVCSRLPALVVHVIVPLGLCLLGGCSSWLPEMVPFGAVTAPDHNRSLNGLGLHRKMWEAAGAKVLTPVKLSPKLDDMDVIVLVGQTYEPPGLGSRRWLENWLAEGDDRTVVYFGRDFSADIYMRRETLVKLPAQDQVRGEELLAQREAGELSERLQQLTNPIFCGWFYLDTQRRSVPYDAFSGEWTDDDRFAELDQNLDSLKGKWPVRVALQPPDNPKWGKSQPSWLSKRRQPNLSQPAEPAQSDDTEALVQQSKWMPHEYDTEEKWESAMADVPISRVLLAADDGQPLVFQLTSEDFGSGQILIVANGAPLLNGSLVEPLHQRIGERLIETCLPASRVALIAYDRSGLTISNVPEKDLRAAGLEMLTVWPLSGITMPAALLGIVVCLALWPILGRPQRLVQRSVSDFGLHVEAIGRMLYEARDVGHAQTVIREYFSKVRGEVPPSWLEKLDAQGEETSTRI